MKPDAENQVTAAVAPAVSQAARRRLLRGGLSALPVALTVASRPVLAGGIGDCKTASKNAMSATFSGKADIKTCNGKNPTYWKQCGLTIWHVSCRKQTGKGNNVVWASRTFSECQLNSFGGTLLTALQGSDQVALHIAAAYLNAAKGYSTAVLDTQKVRDIWNEYVPGKVFEPVAGVRWGATELVAWLKTTMPLSS